LNKWRREKPTFFSQVSHILLSPKKKINPTLGDEVSLLANDFWYRFAGKTSESSQSASNGKQKRSQEEREKAEGAAGVTVNNGESTGAQSPQKKHKMLIEQEDEEEKAAPAQVRRGEACSDINSHFSRNRSASTE
jgi:hypothetical protein